jgi:hypothetical protein
MACTSTRFVHQHATEPCPIVQGDPTVMELYKQEWRNAQLMRAREERLLPNFLRSSFPPEAGPHGVASYPSPSYTTPLHIRQRPAKSVGISLGALDTPGSQRVPRQTAASGQTGGGVGVGRYYPGRKFDWSERGLNDSQHDYSMLRPSVSASGVRTGFGTRREISKGGKYGRTVATVVMTEDSRPSTSSAALGRRAPSSHSYSPHAMSDAMRQSYSTCSRRSRSRMAPFIMDLGRFGAAPQRSACFSDHNTYVTRKVSIHSRLASTANGSTAVSRPQEFGVQTPSQATTRFSTTLSCQSVAKDRVMKAREELDMARATLVSDCAIHLTSTARSLRTYNVSDVAHRPPSAISTIATTFARAPKPSHVVDATLASPCERIGANYSLAAWGLSPRTLQYLADLRSPAGARARLPAEHSLVGDDPPQCVTPDSDCVTQEVHKQMGFMPLELFDDADFEQRTPEEWVALGAANGTFAVTTWFNMNTSAFEHRRVRVLSYSVADRTFAVRFEGNGVEKNVKRLNLCFDSEDAVMFARRVAAARESRSEHEGALRWRFYLDTNLVEEVVDTYDFDAKTEAVWKSSYRVSDKVFNIMKHELITDFYADYCLAIRICNLNYHRKNPDMEAKMEVLRLPPAPVPAPAPERGVCCVVSEGGRLFATFADALTWASDTLFLASPVVHEAMQVSNATTTCMYMQPHMRCIQEFGWPLHAACWPSGSHRRCTAG